MLTRLLRRAAVAAAAAMALVCLAQLPALAGGGPAGGGPSGGGPSGMPSAANRPHRHARSLPGPARRTGRPAPPAWAAAQRRRHRHGFRGQARWPGGCSGTMNKTFGCVPAGCNITVQTLACPIGVAGAAAPGGARRRSLPAPGVLAQLAVRYLRLPDPVIRSSPAPGALQLTRLPVWLWVAAPCWQPQSTDRAGARRVGDGDGHPGVGGVGDGGRDHGHLQRARAPRTRRREPGGGLADVRLHLRRSPAPGSPAARTGSP